MRHVRRVLLLLLLAGLAPGCDIALGVYFATRKKDSSSNSSSSPDATYRVYVKLIASGNEGTEQSDIVTAGGNPGKAGWIQIGRASSTSEFALPATATFNAIAVRANSNQIYTIESIDLLDNVGNVTERASGTTYANLINNPDFILGLPDAKVATTNADATNDAFVFTIYTLANSPTTVRVNLWGVAPESGDIDLIQVQNRAGNQRAGGAALKSNGSLYGMAKDDFGVRAVVLFKYPAGGGTPVTDPAIEADPVTTDKGNNTIVVDQNTIPDSVYIATTYSDPGIAGSGRIHIKKLEGPGTMWSAQTIGTQGVCRVEAHGLALDAAGDLFVAGGVDWGALGGGIGPVLRKFKASDGNQAWLSPPGRPDSTPFDLNGDYYFGVAAQGSDIFLAGSLQQTPPLGSIDIYTERRDGSTLNNGALTWSNFADGPNAVQTSPDLGNAVAVDSLNNVFVGGSYSVAGPQKRAIILSYPIGNPPATTFFVNSNNAPSEILGLTVERISGQTFIYATGYETVNLGTPRKTLFITKFASGGAVIWKRTYNGGFGDDLGISIALDATHLWVWGETSVSASDVDVFYLRVVK